MEEEKFSPQHADGWKFQGDYPHGIWQIYDSKGNVEYEITLKYGLLTYDTRW